MIELPNSMTASDNNFHLNLVTQTTIQRSDQPSDTTPIVHPQQLQILFQTNDWQQEPEAIEISA